ncbi:DUF3530 family protein [Aestuariirhabdus sp. LZHN29]|uniref:DUF3530 family protein n=1 Tax=Aestuariirhabdus sp. LZHN29 TaxID=3417462 RepID=UPI003CEA19AD
MPSRHHLRYLLLCLLAPASWGAEAPATTDPAIERAIPEPTEARTNRELMAHYPRGEVVELPLQQGTLIALYQQRRSSKDRGGVILVAARGQHPDWPQLIAPLRKQLPDQGWHSLSLAPPPLPAPTPPEEAAGASSEIPVSASDAAGNSLEQELRKVALREYQQLLGARISAAREHLSELGVTPQVLLLVGDSAAPAVAALAEEKSAFAALVFINAENDPEGELVKLLQQTPTLTLDLYYGHRQQAAAAERLAAAQRANNRHYYPVQLSGPQNSVDASGERLLKRIESWLKRHPGGGR